MNGETVPCPSFGKPFKDRFDQHGKLKPEPPKMTFPGVSPTLFHVIDQQKIYTDMVGKESQLRGAGADLQTAYTRRTRRAGPPQLIDQRPEDVMPGYVSMRNIYKRAGFDFHAVTGLPVPADDGSSCASAAVPLPRVGGDAGKVPGRSASDSHLFGAASPASPLQLSGGALVKNKWVALMGSQTGLGSRVSAPSLLSVPTTNASAAVSALGSNLPSAMGPLLDRDASRSDPGAPQPLCPMKEEPQTDGLRSRRYVRHVSRTPSNGVVFGNGLQMRSIREEGCMFP